MIVSAILASVQCRRCSGSEREAQVHAYTFFLRFLKVRVCGTREPNIDFLYNLIVLDLHSDIFSRQFPSIFRVTIRSSRFFHRIPYLLHLCHSALFTFLFTQHSLNTSYQPHFFFLCTFRIRVPTFLLVLLHTLYFLPSSSQYLFLSQPSSLIVL